jgi:hypothetical protein
LFNKLVTDVTVDQVVPWQDLLEPSRLEQAAKRGNAVPLSPVEMHRIYPDLWSSSKAAERYLQETPKHQIEYLFSKRVFIVVKYKLASGKGRYFTAYATKEASLESLESVVGKVAEYHEVTV